MIRLQIHPKLAGRLAFGLLAWMVVAQARTEPSGQLQTRIQSLQQQIRDLGQDKQDLERELARLERGIGQRAHEIQDLEQEARALKHRRQTLTAELDLVHRHLRKLHRRLARQIRTAHALGRPEPLKLLLSQADPSRLSRMLTYYRYLNQARLEQIDQTRQQLAQIQRLAAEVKQAEQRLAEILERQRQSLAEMQALHGERQRLIARLEKELSNRRARLARLKAEQRHLARVVTLVRRTSEDIPFPVTGNRPFHQLRGRLHWPVEGNLATVFGSRRMAGRWEGVVIQAPEGTPVHAVLSGRVVFADWLRGYGFLIIIQHDREFMTLYAFNQHLLKRPGDQVRTGEVIAKVGRSGGRTRPGLYFAIRRRGEPVDPRHWCRKP